MPHSWDWHKGNNMFTLRKDKTPLQFAAKATNKTLQLDIMDEIGSDMFGNGISAALVKDALDNDEQEDYSDITLNLNSPGGDLFEGVAIYNLLKGCGKPVNVNVLGVAASAASLIAMAGDKVCMNLGTQMMIHEGMALCAGFADDMRKMADTLDQVTASAADLYVGKTKLSKDKILAMMKAETWMNPEQAKANGFADEISKEQSVKNNFNLSVFKNTPAEFENEAKTKKVDGEHLTAGDFIYVGDPDYSIRMKQIELERLR